MSKSEKVKAWAAKMKAQDPDYFRKVGAMKKSGGRFKPGDPVAVEYGKKYGKELGWRKNTPSPTSKAE